METRTAPSVIGGRYRVEGLLGEGGMARVFDAFDERLERPVAVKILRSETQAIPGMRQRFQQEALIAARLIHPNIVAVLDFGEEQASSYLVMERLPGSTLRDEIVARGPLPTQRVLRVMAETLGALAAAHKFGVLHRDIKPSNILLQEDGHTKIADFGIAKSFDLGMDLDRLTDDMTLTGVVLGHSRLPRPRTEIGPPGHGAVRPVLRGGGDGRDAHGPTRRSRSDRDRGASASVARRRTPCSGPGPRGPLRIRSRHAGNAENQRGCVDPDQASGAHTAVDHQHRHRAHEALTRHRHHDAATPGAAAARPRPRSAPTRPRGRGGRAGRRRCARPPAR